MQIGVTLDIPFTIQHSLFQRPPALLTPCFPLHSEIRASRYSSEPQALSHSANINGSDFISISLSLRVSVSVKITR